VLEAELDYCFKIRLYRHENRGVMLYAFNLSCPDALNLRVLYMEAIEPIFTDRSKAVRRRGKMVPRAADFSSHFNC
jgi:hypothetical protein